MPESSTLTIFVGAAMLLFIVPGPAVLYVVTRSLSQGRNAGLVSVGGIHAGSLVHILAAMLGLSALVATSTLAFSIVKWAGAAYLVYLGIRTLLADDDALLPGTAEPSSYRKIFTQGAIVNVLNPKTAIFFVAFVPLFIDPGRGSTTLQILVLGIAFIFAGTISDGLYALLA
ncbi:MAG: LysE family translocator, partial [Actinomycetota bacterium]|nr:LysE family translocator [Actinomycetota bacterium]